MSTHSFATTAGLRTLAASIILIAASPASAQFQKPEDAIKYRQSAFSLIGTHFGRIGAVVKGEAPYNKDDVAKNAAIIATLIYPAMASFWRWHRRWQSATRNLD